MPVLVPRLQINTNSAHVMGTVALPDDATSVTLELERAVASDPTKWADETTAVSVRLEISLDGGQSWQSAGGFTANGGAPRLNWRDEEVTVSSARFWLAPGISRQLRGTITKTNGPQLSTFGTVYYDTTARSVLRSTHHSIAYDNADSVQGTGANSITIPAFATAGTNRLLFVGAGNSAATAKGTTSVSQDRHRKLYRKMGR